MALEFDGKTSGEIITVTDPWTDSGDLDPSTVIMWMYLDDLTVSDMIFTRQTFSGRTWWHAQTFGADTHMDVAYPRATTAATAESGDGFLESGKWLCVAITYTSGGSGPKLFKGTLTTAMAEESSYTSQSDGSGGTKTPNQDIGIFNRISAAFSIDGRAALWRMIKRDLALAELEALRSRPYTRDPDDFIFLIPGLHGTTNIYDQSGNGNDGTGALLATGDGLPLPLILVPDTSDLTTFATPDLVTTLIERRYPRGAMSGVMRGAA